LQEDELLSLISLRNDLKFEAPDATVVVSIELNFYGSRIQKLLAGPKLASNAADTHLVSQQHRRTTSTTTDRHDAQVPIIDVNTLETAEEIVKEKADKVRAIHEKRVSEGEANDADEDTPKTNVPPKLSSFDIAKETVLNKAKKVRESRTKRIHDGGIEAGSALKDKGRTIGERTTSKHSRRMSEPRDSGEHTN
jgi:hypothetical protein